MPFRTCTASMCFLMRIELRSAALFSFLLFLLAACNGDDSPQVLCDDPAALNYAPDAVGNRDCNYPSRVVPVETVAILDGALNEISGLEIFQDFLVGHNDRGNAPDLFFINPNTGEPEHLISVTNVENRDWEDLAANVTYLFIGDFGNNDGIRTDLGIHRVPKNDLYPGISGEVHADATIAFRYPEQTVFGGENHDFDCEASFWYNGYLYLFTKHNSNRRTNMYRIPDTPGTVHDAELLGGFEVGGRITGADISADGAVVALAGNRRSGNCFVWKLSNFPSGAFLEGDKEQLVMGPFAQFGQVESVKITPDGGVFVASEAAEEFGLSPKLYFISEF